MSTKTHAEAVIEEGDDGSVPGTEGTVITDEIGTDYYLTGDQLAVFDEHDAQCATDAEFWAWFTDWRQAAGIRALPKKKGKRRGSAQPRWDDYWDRADSRSPYLSSWALDGVHSYFRGSSDQSGKLAVALGAVSSTVRVLEPSAERYRVKFTASGDEPAAGFASFTSFAEHLVSVSPLALLDTGTAEGDGIDITTGFGLHEGSHVRFTGDLMELLRSRTDLSPAGVAALLLNLAEDCRIERATAAEYPGFAPYFDKANAYLWRKVNAPLAPKAWGPELKHKLNAAILMVKWPADYEPLVRAAGNAALAAEWPWWQAWRERYVAGADAADTVRDALDHLREDPGTSTELDGIAAQEADCEDLLERIREGLQKLGSHLEPCPTEGRTEGKAGVPAAISRSSAKPSAALSPSVAIEVETLVDEELMIDKPHLRWPDATNGAERTKVHVLRPKVEPAELEPPDAGLVARMREAFKLRPVAREWQQRLLRSGRVDEAQLWRHADHDYRLFSRKISRSKPETAITLLVDQSGSMGDEKLRQALEAARIMHACLRDMPGVTLRVRSHTADTHEVGHGNAVVYRIWEQGDPLAKLGQVYRLPHANNADGFAIEWCARELLGSARPQAQKVLIVLADGQPAYSGYRHTWGGADGPGMGYTHVRLVTDWCEAQGVTVIQIAIDPALSAEHQARMFRHWLPYQGLERLPRQITALLRSLF